MAGKARPVPCPSFPGSFFFEWFRCVERKMHIPARPMTITKNTSFLFVGKNRPKDLSHAVVFSRGRTRPPSSGHRTSRLSNQQGAPHVCESLPQRHHRRAAEILGHHSGQDRRGLSAHALARGRKRRLADILHGFQPGVHGRLPGQVEEEGLVGVQGKNFHELVRRLPPGEIGMRLDAASGNCSSPRVAASTSCPPATRAGSRTFPPSRERGGGLVRGFPPGTHRPRGLLHKRRGHHAGHGLHVFPAGRRIRVEVCGLNGHQFALAAFFNDDVQAMLPAEGILIQKSTSPNSRNGSRPTRSNWPSTRNACSSGARTSARPSACR